MVREAKDTKMRFANALFELCETKDINKITVSDVLRATGAAKQTFYNHFKDINDQYGHAVGDEALLKVGTLLRQTFPEGLAIRWGGDEFVVAVFGERDPRELREQAEGLLAKLCERSTVDEHARPLTGSIGIVTSDDQNFSIDELIRRSDEALYRAKRAGKSQCCVYGEGEPAR